MSEFKFPTVNQRLAIIGRTGSGKTQFAAWILSHAAFDKQPYVIVDYKGDQLLGSIDKAEEIELNFVPKHSGLYIVRPRPDQGELVERWLWKVWEREKVGLYFDEMYLVPDPARGGALRSIFTQGRSKRLPVIGLTQRPRHISRFLFSEADAFAVFHLNTRGDNLAVEEFTPIDTRQRLPDYHCRWYDVNRDTQFILRPVPNADDILARFEDRLKQKRKFL